MKTTRSTPLLLAALVLCGGALTAYAQPQPPVRTPAKAKPAAKAGKAATARKPRAKNLTARMITATEEQMGKAMTPALKDQLTTALRAREAAIQEANRVYYEAFAEATGLTPEQAKEIDKPSRKKAAPAAGGDMKKTDMTQLTTTKDDDDDDNEPAPATPANQK